MKIRACACVITKGVSTLAGMAARPTGLPHLSTTRGRARAGISSRVLLVRSVPGSCGTRNCNAASERGQVDGNNSAGFGTVCRCILQKVGRGSEKKPAQHVTSLQNTGYCRTMIGRGGIQPAQNSSSSTADSHAVVTAYM